MFKMSHCDVSSGCRSWDLLQHAGLPGWSVVGHAGGQDLPALPQRRRRHAGPQVLLGVLQMERIYLPRIHTLISVLCHLMAVFHRFVCSVFTHLTTFVISVLQGVAEPCAIETARGQHSEFTCVGS